MASKIDIVIQAVDNLSATMAKIEANVKRTTTQMNNSMRSIQTTTKQASDATVSSVNNMNTAFGTFSTNVRRIGALVGSIYAVRSALQALAGVSDDFKDFNANMAYVNTIAQLTDEQLAALTVTVSDLSVELGKAAPELARGLYDVYSSGFEGAEAMKILEVSTKGAIAGLTTTEVAARGLMAVMNAYNRKTGADAVEIMDNMFKTVDKGVVTFEELATQIGSVVTMSSQLGIPFDQVSAAMSEMTLRGLSAAESATALEGLMRSLMKPADQAKEAIKKLNENQKGLNFEWDIATLRAKGLNGMMVDLAEATQGNFEVVGAIIPEIRGMRAAMVLGSQDGEGFNKMLEEQKNSLGATQAAYEQANKSIKRQLEEVNAQWDEYKRKAGEAIANVELGFMKSIVSMAQWAERNQTEIIAVLETIKQLTLAFLAYKAAMIAVMGVNAIFSWLAKLQAVLLVTTGEVVTLKLALTALAMPIVITVALAGVAAVLYDLNLLLKAKRELADQKIETANMIAGGAVRTTEKVVTDYTSLNNVIATAQKANDKKTYEAAKDLKLKIFNLDLLYAEKNTVLAREAGKNDVSEINRRMDIQKAAILAGQKELEASGKLAGGLSVLPKVEVVKPAGPTVPVYPGFPSTESLLGPDDALSKIQDKIKKVKADISEFYGKIGDFTNDFKKELEDQANSLGDLSTKFSRYLEDTNTDLTRLEDKHSETIKSIDDDISNENKKFNDSMDERARKFNDTMDEMRISHTDKTDDIQHEIDLELGMGLRADQEKLRSLRERLARENRDYADNVADNITENNLANTSDRNDNAARLADLQERLAQEKEDYQQRVDDIKTQMDREKIDYADQQNEILKKTQETLQGVVSSYQKAFKSVYDAIIESGVPSLLSQLPSLTKTALDNSIQGVTIPRNIMAEQEFVKNWGGRYGRLPSKEEISMGVYGTSSGPNTEAGVNVTINNPVVTNQTMIDSLVQQATRAIAEAQRLAKNGAY